MAFYVKVCFAAGTLLLSYMLIRAFDKGIQEKNVSQDKSDQNYSVETFETKFQRKKKKSKGSKPAMRLQKLKPNFFLGVQVFDSGIHQKVKKIQESIIQNNPLLLPALVDISTLHVTLAVTHLANEKDIKIIKEKLEDWSDKNTKLFFREPLVLNFTGIKTFNDVVAYVGVEECENYHRLLDLSKAMNSIICSAGFTTDNRGFTPHLTILKLGKHLELMKSKKQFKNVFDSLKQCQDHFGKQEVKHIQLLSMDEPKDINGYYKCLHQINTAHENELKTDHNLCCAQNPKAEVDVSEPSKKDNFS